MEGTAISHLCVIQTVLRDPDALQRACQRLGWQFHVGGRVKYYSGLERECDFTIEMTGEMGPHGYRLSDRYNIGIVRQADGTYSMLCDNAMCTSAVERDTRKQIGETPRIVGKLTQAYNWAVLEAECALQGYGLTSKVRDDGTISVYMEVA